MTLDGYQAKRDFDRTPEPAGDSTGHEGRLYVIQKHAASRLHYDFRLELDGVLLSWAVPKGPSLDPRDKRLAVRVEDHPVEYGGFEGTIPKGEYGGGTVALWDRGTWEPEGDPHEGLARGDLKFALHGEKLSGSWVLVRMKKASAAEGKENWLLIKHRDADAVDGDGAAILRERPESVATGRTIEEIAAASDQRVPDPTDAEGAVLVASLPDAPQPELATLVRSAPKGDDWLHEVKLDGYRTLARIDDGTPHLFSRGGADWTERYPRIARELAALPAKAAILDGEVVVTLENGVTDFGALQADLAAENSDRMRYGVFDLLHLDGYDLTATPLHLRKKLLASLLASHPAGKTLFYVDDIHGQGPAFAAQACAAGLEGIVSKRASSVYRPGVRSRDWLKVKCLSTEEFEIVGYTPPAGTRTGFGALLLGERTAGDELRYVGRVGTGFTARFLESFGRTLRSAEQTDASVVEGAERAPADARWVAPQFVAEVTFAERTAAGELRQASFKRLRDENPSPVTLTNPRRVFWPLTDTTKEDLARYYERVASHMLPYVMHRPISMVRCPRGVGAQGTGPHPGAASCFFHKHPGADFPGSFERVEIVESKGPAAYLAITDADSLRALAQMGVLEIHTWGSTWPDIEHPDIVVFDLDPGEGVEWGAVADAARLVRDVLDGLDLKSFVKTTGGSGLHVCAPIVPENGWDDIKRFTRAIADGIAAFDPSRYVATMAKEKRKGRVFIDYLRNTRTATFIAPYSTRAHARPTVAVPIRWDELGGVRSDTYDVTSVPRRLSHLQSDPWEGFFDLEQRITVEIMAELGLG